MADLTSEHVTDNEWEEFKKKFNKAYATEEEDTIRRNLYIESKKKIIEHEKKFQKGEVTFKMGINQFSDRRPDECPGGLRGFQASS